MHKHPQQSLRPFFKWAGGKQRVLDHILPHLPHGARLIEPFVGAGSLFLASSYPTYLLNDANLDLIAVWRALQQEPSRFIAAASSFFVEQHRCADAYNDIRLAFNATSSPWDRAIRLPYLNKFGFNGLYRVNSHGQFNSPYGHPKAVPHFPKERMVASAHKLQSATILDGSYENAIEEARIGDVVYCDPPYLPTQHANSFTAYTNTGFAIEDQKRLVALAQKAVARGAHVLISNHDTPLARQIYTSFDIKSFDVPRSIGGTGATRKPVRELLAMLRPK